MNLVLFDTTSARSKLLPFTYTRPIANIRVGILTISEKWELCLNLKASFLTEPYLSTKFPALLSDDNLFILGTICPDGELLNAINTLQPNQSLVVNGLLIASRQGKVELEDLGKECVSIEYGSAYTSINRTWHIFKENGDQIKKDFELITSGRKSKPIKDAFTRVYAQENIFIEEGASIKDATLNAEQGPIYIGKGAHVEEGSIIRGPFALCDYSTLNAGARIRGDTTIGPKSKVGGEISNSVIFGYSNKGHDGFMGNSVVGEWCNLGADTNTSNLKNNYNKVKVWDYEKSGFVKTEEQFCGLMMGDHSKCGINTMFNTGTVVGLAANIFGSGFPRTFIPSFAWGGASGFSTFKLDKVFEMATASMKRRNCEFNSVEKDILTHVFELEAPYRNWENQR